MKEIWFIRHAESQANIGLPTKNCQETFLTELGHLQAARLAETVSKPDLFVTSSYLRTQQTAKPTLIRYPDVPVEIWPVQEFTYLSQEKYCNTSNPQRQPFARAYWERADPNYQDGIQAESFQDMATRIYSAWKTALSRPEKFIIIFSHGQVMKTLWYCLAANLDMTTITTDNMNKINNFIQHVSFPNTCTLKYRDGWWQTNLFSTL